jgi:hypothetical protein
MAHVRGLHETGGIQALHVVRAKAQPGTLTTKLARLDHQRGLLERQLAVWTEKQQVTRERLTVVEKQMAEVGRLVRACTVPRRGRRRRAAVAAAGGQGDGAVAPSQKQPMKLEY